MARSRKNQRKPVKASHGVFSGDHFRGWYRHHAYSLLSSLGELIRRPVSAGMTVMVLALALTLPLGVFLVLGQASQWTQGIDRLSGLSVFLESDLAEADALRLSSEWAVWSDVTAVDPISPADGLAEALSHLGVVSMGLGLDENPLPWVLEVTPAPQADVKVLSERFLDNAEVAQVIVDLAWLTRLERLIELGERVAYIVWGLLLLAFLFVIAHSIRMEVQHRRDQIEVMALVGATAAFIRRPFLYSGFWFGASAAVLALFFVFIARLSVASPLSALAESYQINWQLSGLGLGASVGLIAGMGCLGMVGAWVAVSQQLSDIWPRESWA